MAGGLAALLDDIAALAKLAAASLDEQREVWKAHKPKKGDPQVSWWSVANALTRKRMYARDASFGDELAQAYGIEWVEDLFAPADEDSRYTTQVEAFLGQEDADAAGVRGRRRRAVLIPPPPPTRSGSDTDRVDRASGSARSRFERCSTTSPTD